MNDAADNSTLYLVIYFWERYGFYGVTSVLIIFMKSQLGYSDYHGYMLFASYMALMHITPIIGGYIARNVLGYMQSFILGLVLLVAGCVPIPGHFYLSLALIVVGQGFFKSMPFKLPEIVFSSANKKRHQFGLSFAHYIVVNIICIIPLLISGYLAMYNCWSTSFVCGGLSMMLGTFSFLSFYSQMRALNKDLELRTFSFKVLMMVSIYVFFLVLFSRYLLVYPLIVLYGIFIYAIFIITVLCKRFFQMSKEDILKVVVLSLTVFCSAIFFALNYQQSTSLTVFIYRYISCDIFGYHIPCEVYWILNPFWIIILSVLYCLLRKYTSINHQKLPPVFRLMVGGASIAISYFLLSFACSLDKTGSHISGWWVVTGYMFQAISEICVFNCLLFSDFTRLLPEDIKKIHIPLWFITYAIGCAMIGIIANQASVPTRFFSTAGGYIHVYSHAFFIFSVISSLVCLLLLFLAKPFYSLYD